MANELVSFVDQLKSDKQLASYDVASLKQTVVMKLLFLLGWDIFNLKEVSPNHGVGKQQVDYALQIKNKSKVFVNVKKVGASLDKHQKELFKLAVAENVELSALTNGMAWQLFLTLGKKKPEQKQFCSINFASQSSQEIAKQLEEFLSKEQVAKGEALKRGETRINEKHQKLVEETLPKAWQQIISDPPDVLVNLLIEAAEKIGGFSPEKKTAAKFLSESIATALKTQTAAPAGKQPAPDTTAREPQRPSAPPEIPKPASRGYDEQSISSFSFKKKEYTVKAWGDLVFRLCEVLSSEYGQDIEKLLWHSVGDKYYFSRDASELRFPENIKGTDIFVQTIRSGNEAVKAARSILSFFGYAKDDFTIAAK